MFTCRQVLKYCEWLFSTMYTEPFCVILWWRFHLSITQYIIAGALTDERSNFDGVIRSYTISKFIQELIPLAIPRTPDKVLLIQENIPSIIGSCPFFSWKGTKTHHAWKEWWWVTYVWMQDSPKYLCGVHQSQMWPILWGFGSLNVLCNIFRHI